MEEKIVFDKEMWDSLMNMFISPDEESRTLALGLLENFDYTNKNNLDEFEEFLHVCIGHIKTNSETKGKLLNSYFTALTKYNECQQLQIK